MFRALLAFAVLAVVVLVPGGAEADRSARNMFDVLEKDFGIVERGKVLTHHFMLTNTGAKELRIRKLRVSCTCVQAVAAKNEVAPGETVGLTAIMDTGKFAGAKSVTIYVDFDRPHRVEVPLRVHCKSVSEVEPVNEIDFGHVSKGSVVAKKLNVDYAGDAQWRIVGLTYGNPHLHAEAVEVLRTKDRVRYELRVTLDGTAPEGEFADRIHIETSSSGTPRIDVAIRSTIEPSIKVVPDRLSFAPTTTGEPISRKLIVQTDRPFRVLRVDKTDGFFEVRSAQEPKSTQLVVVTLTGPADLKQLPDHLEFVTDLPGERIVSVQIEH